MIVGCADAPAARPQVVNAFVPGATEHNVLKIQEYRLHLHHLHTGESIDVVYRRGNVILPNGVAELNRFLRDHRTGEMAHYPIAAFDLLHDLLLRLHEINGVIDIVCGYRSPASNTFLRTRSKHTGVVEHSEHMLSQAIDLRVPGRSTEAVRAAALSLGEGGVGYYPQSGFVHVDVGPVRQWSFGSVWKSRPNRKKLTRHHKASQG